MNSATSDRETRQAAGPAALPRARAWAEFIGFFVLAPLALALLLPPTALFPALFAVTALGLALLHLTPGFRWPDLISGAGRIGWGFVAVFALATAAVGSAVMLATAPEGLLALPLERPELMLTIALLYPVLSALPQEIVYRPLFFRRYAAVLPSGTWSPVLLNAGLFSFAHLMYWSWIVAAMTFSGGLAFAWSYHVRRNFPEAVLLHAVAGVIVFALGLGVYFYSGNVTRPF